MLVYESWQQIGWCVASSASLHCSKDAVPVPFVQSHTMPLGVAVVVDSNIPSVAIAFPGDATDGRGGWLQWSSLCNIQRVLASDQ